MGLRLERLVGCGGWGRLDSDAAAAAAAAAEAASSLAADGASRGLEVFKRLSRYGEPCGSFGLDAF